MAKPANKKPTRIKPMALKGFREWLPEEKILEQLDAYVLTRKTLVSL
jgi:hypothetical protein